MYFQAFGDHYFKLRLLQFYSKFPRLKWLTINSTYFPIQCGWALWSSVLTGCLRVFPPLWTRFAVSSCYVVLFDLISKWTTLQESPMEMHWCDLKVTLWFYCPLSVQLKGTQMCISAINYSYLYARVISHKTESSGKRSYDTQPFGLQFTNATINFSFSNDEGYINCSSWNKIMTL
jgi:hypothetical protein